MRVRFDERPGERRKLKDVVELLIGVQVLLLLSELDLRSSGDDEFDVKQELDGVWVDLEDATTVRRLSYQSPLEVVLAVGTVTSTLYGVTVLAERCARLIERYHDVRVRAAKAGLEISAVQVLQGELAFIEKLQADDTDRARLVELASNALAESRSADVNYPA